jgi:hypothetical protein
VFLEDEDALGTYRVEIVAHDRVAGTSARAEGVIELVEYAEGPDFADADEVWSWAWNYYKDPQPTRALPAVRALAPLGTKDIALTHGALIELFERNAWLVPHVTARINDEDAATRALLTWILARTSYAEEEDVAALLARLDADERALWRQHAAAADPLAEPIAGREHVNELFGRYTLSRGYLPLRRLVDALDRRSGAVADVTIHEPTNDVDVPLSHVVDRFVAKQLSRFLPDVVTRGYLEVMARDEAVSETSRARIESLFEEGNETSGK